jgi:tetratricopeptide (TPR) repeat protein
MYFSRLNIRELSCCMALALAVGSPNVACAAGDHEPIQSHSSSPPEKWLPCARDPQVACLIDLALGEIAAAGSEQQFRAQIQAASILVDTGDNARALEVLRSALVGIAGDSFHDYSESLPDIAILQYRAGDDTAARETLGKADEIMRKAAPERFETVRRLASAHIVIGDQAGAIAAVETAVHQSACTMLPKARLPFLVETAGWYLEIGNLEGVEDIALRIHVSLVRAGGSFGYSTRDGKTVAAITSRLLGAGKYDTAADFLGLSQAPDTAAPLLSAIEKLPKDTSPNTLAYFVTRATRWIGRSESVAGRIDSLQRAAHIFDRISQTEMAADLRQQALRLVLAIDDAPTRMNELLSMARYEESIGRMPAAHTMLAMAMDAARDAPAEGQGPRLEQLVQTAIDLQEVDLVRAVLRTQVMAVDKISSLTGRIGGKLRIASLQARAGMAVDARESLVEGIRLARQLSKPGGADMTGSLFLALAIAHAGDGVGALEALEMAEGTVLYDANTAAEVSAEIAIDRWQAGEMEVALSAIDRADAALDTAAQEPSLEPSLAISFAHGIAGNTPAAVEGLGRALQIADAVDKPEGRAAALLRAAQFAAAVRTNHFDPKQLQLEGWKMLGE